MENQYIKHMDAAAFATWNADFKTRIQAAYTLLGITRTFNQYTFTHPATSGSAIYSFVNGDFDLVASLSESALKLTEEAAIADGMFLSSDEV